MEESFRVRVDKTFGSLSEPSLPSSQPIGSSLWSLTDDELQPNRWTRESDDPVSDDDIDDVDKSELINALKDSSSFPRDVNKLFVAASQNPNTNPNWRDYEGESTSAGKGANEMASSSRDIEEIKDDDDDELDVRNSIGLDSTLDFEEEEDEFDKFAVGKEKPDDRLYMCDVSDYVSHPESCNEVLNTFQEASRDPRANLIAAKIRLKEDAETARDFNLLHVSEQSLPELTQVREKILAVSSGQNNGNDGELCLKSILKRKDQMDSKSEKRVRFDPRSHNNAGDENEVNPNVTSETHNTDISLHEDDSSQLKQISLVPDYIRNPSKYMHYTFDTSSDLNEAANRQAYADFLSMLRKSEQSEPDEAPADLSKPVMFNLKKKPCDVKVTSSETDCTIEGFLNGKRPCIAVGSELEDEACEMDVDEQENSTLKAGNVKKAGRRYRSKLSLQYDESEA